MIKLTDQLKNASAENHQEMSETSAITQATRLIAEGGAEDVAILRAMGMNSSFELAQKKHSDRLEFEKLQKQYGDVYHIDAIKKVACQYALKFLRSDNYKGNIDGAMFSKIKQFFKENNIEFNGAQLGFKMFVLARPQDFNLQPKPLPADPEPALFYKLDDNNYRLIHKWGTDLTLWRRILGFKYSSRWNFFWYGLLKNFLLIAMPIYFLGSYLAWHFNISQFIPLSVSGAVFLVGIICAGVMASDSSVNIGSTSDRPFNSWKESWMSPYKIDF